MLCARLRAKPWKLAVCKLRWHSEVNRARSCKLWWGILFCVGCCGGWIVIMTPILHSLETWPLALPFCSILGVAMLLPFTNGVLGNRIPMDAQETFACLGLLTLRLSLAHGNWPGLACCGVRPVAKGWGNPVITTEAILGYTSRSWPPAHGRSPTEISGAQPNQQKST